MNFRTFIVVLILQLVFFSAYPQQQNPMIDSLIQLITPESYRFHFDSIRTSEISNRKVAEGKVQSLDHDACRDYIFNQFRYHLGDENSYCHFFESENYGGLCNVIGFKKGTSPWKGVWIIGAHYDSNNNMEENKNEQHYSPGANDNGTGIAAVLEIVRILSKIEIEHSVIFAAWDLEEVFTNMLATGSNEWYKKYVRKRVQTNWLKTGSGGIISYKDIKGVINFDMFGNPLLLKDNRPVLWVCYANNSHIEFTDRYAETVNRYVKEIYAMNFGKLIVSDHYSFASRNLPSIENLESGYKNDLFYHRSEDHLANKENINFSFACNVTKGGLAFILENAGIFSSIRKPPLKVSVNEGLFAYTIDFQTDRALIQIFDVSGNCVAMMNPKSSSIEFMPEVEGLYHFIVQSPNSSDSFTVHLKKKEELSAENSSPFYH